MAKLHFRLRSLFVLTTLAGILTFPTYHAVTNWLEQKERDRLQLPTLASTTVHTVVSVPDGGTMVIGSIVIRPDGTQYPANSYPATSSSPASQNLKMLVTQNIEIQPEEDEDIIPAGPSNIE